MGEGESSTNPIEVLEENIERRFVVGFRGSEVATPLIVAHEDRFAVPLRLSHRSLAEAALGDLRNRKGGFCIKIGEQLIMADDPPGNMLAANAQEFNQALQNGVKVVEPVIIKRISKG